MSEDSSATQVATQVRRTSEVRRTLGGMSAGWAMKKLDDICVMFADGDWIESKDQSLDGIRLIQTGNVGNGFFKNKDEKARYISESTFERLNCTEIFPGDCLISRLPDPVGRSCILPNTGQQMITAVDCTIVRFKSDEIIPEFFNYYSQSLQYLSDVDHETTGTTRKRISRKRLGLIQVPVPPMEEQRRIVAVLAEAMTAVATTVAHTERNLVNGRELFDATLQSIFANRLDDAAHQSLNDICGLIVDCEHKTAPTQEEGYASIRTPNIGRGLLLLDGVNRVSEQTYKEWTRRAVPQSGDLILAREAPAGNVAVIPENLKVCLGQRTVLIRPSRNKVDSRFLMYLLLSNDMQKLLLSNSRGATVVHVNMLDIRGLAIGELPPLDEQRAIVTQLDALAAETQRLTAVYQQKLAALTELKQSILQQAFSPSATHLGGASHFEAQLP